MPQLHNLPARFHPSVKTMTYLGVAQRVGMHTIVGGVAIDWIEVQLGGHEVNVVGFTTAELFEHALHQSMLDAFPAPA